MGNNHGRHFQTTRLGDEDSGWLFLVLEYCDLSTRSSVAFVSKRYLKILTTEASFRWRLERLHIEYGVYFSHNLYSPAAMKMKESSLDYVNSYTCYKSLYLQLLKKRMMWRVDNDTSHPSFTNGYDDDKVAASSYTNDKKSTGIFNATKDDSFNVEVGVRFKPLLTSDREVGEYKNDDERRTVTLPLHQRLALIRRNRNLSSNFEAISILKNNGEWFGGRNHNDCENDLGNAKVIHLGDDTNENNCSGDNKQEMENAYYGEQIHLSCGIHSIDQRKKSVVIVDPIKGLRQFRFDTILSDTCTQHEVYETTARPLVSEFLNGINATCLVYGVTGSGKSFTMFGPNHDDQSIEQGSMYQHENLLSEMQGIVPRACNEIFEAIRYRKRELNIQINADVSVSYVEVFGNEIGDLLRGGSLCSQNKAANHRFVLSGAFEFKVADVKDVMKALHIGEAQKKKAATAMNARSSRAHSIFIVTLKQICEATGISRTSKLFMVDLGGCEQTKKSDIKSGSSKHYDHLRQKMLMNRKKVNDYEANQEESDSSDSNIDVTSKYSIGFVKSDRMREAVHINLGLMALKACVNALNSRNPNEYVPYTNSKLTMLLSSALGGNSKTSVIVCSGQEKDLTTQTIAAMKFGQSCRRVQNVVKCMTDLDFLQQLIDNFDERISHCEAEIRRKEKWVVQERKRVDTLAEEGTLEGRAAGEEICRTTVLVGAEKEHIQLHHLLRKKAELTGERVDGAFGGRKFGGGVGFGNAHYMGFGRQSNEENEKDNYRFREMVEAHEIPKAVKAQGSRWDDGKDDDIGKENITKLSGISNNAPLVYYGLSA